MPRIKTFINPPSEDLIYPSSAYFRSVLYYMRDEFAVNPLYSKYIVNPSVINYRLHALFFNPDDDKQYKKFIVTVVENSFDTNSDDTFRFFISIDGKLLGADTIHMVFLRILAFMGNDIQSFPSFNASEETSLSRIREIYALPDTDDKDKYVLDDKTSGNMREWWHNDMKRYQAENELFSGRLLPFTTLVHNLKRPSSARILGASEVFANRELVDIIRKQGFLLERKKI